MKLVSKFDIYISILNFDWKGGNLLIFFVQVESVFERKVFLGVGQASLVNKRLRSLRFRLIGPSVPPI